MFSFYHNMIGLILSCVDPKTAMNLLVLELSQSDLRDYKCLVMAAEFPDCCIADTFSAHPVG